MICKNCNHHFEGKFCNNCGQSADTKRLNYHSIRKDLINNFLHFNDKILFTGKELTIRPGHTIREYIEGKRVNHLTPISFLLLVVSVYVLLDVYFHIHVLDKNVTSGGTLQQVGYEKTNEWFVTHYSWFALFLIPPFSLSTFLFFKKQGYNFVEHLVINTYVVGQQYMLLVLMFPFTYWLNDTPQASLLQLLILLGEFIMKFWVYNQLFIGVTKLRVFMMLLTTYILLSALLLLLLVLVMMRLGVYKF